MRLRLERNGVAHNIVFLILKEDVVQIIGLSSCKGMDLISIKDSDNLSPSKPQSNSGERATTNTVAGNAAYATTHEVGSTQGACALQDPLLMQYKDVFEGLGCIPGTHNIRVDEPVTPVE